MKLSPQPELFDIRVAAGRSRSCLWWSMLPWFVSCLLMIESVPCLQTPKKHASQLPDTSGISTPRLENKTFPDTSRPPKTKHVVNGLSYQTAQPPFKLRKPQSIDTYMKWSGRYKLNSSSVLAVYLTMIVQWYFPEESYGLRLWLISFLEVYGDKCLKLIFLRQIVETINILPSHRKFSHMCLYEIVK